MDVGSSTSAQSQVQLTVLKKANEQQGEQVKQLLDAQAQQAQAQQAQQAQQVQAAPRSGRIDTYA